MKKQRLFYLDFIRAVATLLIVTFHYNSLFYNESAPLPALVGTFRIGNIYMGAFGVSLFLIISGAGLMLSYGNSEKTDLKLFYKKRAISIYPAFFTAFVIVFLLNFYKNGALPAIPRKNIIFSFLGLDGYLSMFGVKTFYTVGEWFVGFIIIIYVIFPLILWLMRKNPYILAAVTTALYIPSVLLFKDKSFVAVLITVRLPEIVFGMFFIKYIKNVKWYAALISLAVIILNGVLKPSFINGNFQCTYVGIAAFLLLAFIARFIEFPAFVRICSAVCKYSYPCFIIHHFVIIRLTEKFDFAALSRFNSYLLYLLCLICVGAASVMLYFVTEKLKGLLGLSNQPADKKA